MRELLHAIRDDDDDERVQHAVLAVSRSRRYLAPLALAVGAIAMLVEGLRLVFSNWRLSLVQVLPAMWIWVAMLDLKVHLLHGRAFRDVRGPVLVPIAFGVVVITATGFLLNAVFAHAISQPGKPAISPAFSRAWAQRKVVLAWGVGVGVLLAFATVVVPRWGIRWFALTLSVVIGVMMLTYVAVPARLVGLRTTYSRRDKLAAGVVGGAVGAIVCTPPYLIGRLGIVMLGSRALFVPGIIVLTFGFTLQAGATGAVKSIKFSAKVMAGHRPSDPHEPPTVPASPGAT